MAFRAGLDDFASLYERTYQPIYRTILGICADPTLAADLTQDAFLQAYRQRATFRGEVPVEAWLHRIAVNAALDGLRRRRVRWAEPLDPDRHDRSAPTPDSGELLDIQRALARLDPRNRAAVVLRYYHGLDYATIAAILGTSVSNVGAILSRSLARLRRDLERPSPMTSPVATTTEEAGSGR